MDIADTFFKIRNVFETYDNRNCALPLKAVVTLIDTQICSRPYDRIFGLLGVTNSRLNPGYSTRKIALYLRVLIEGTLERGQVVSPILKNLEGHCGWVVDIRALRLVWLLQSVNAQP